MPLSENLRRITFFALSLIDFSFAKFLNTENRLWYLFSVLCVCSFSMNLD